MATTVTSVRPGEVISSDLMNYFLGKLAELDQRVSTLESGGPTTGQVRIESFDPPNQQAAGQVLSILGSNFAFPPTDNAVSIDDVFVTSFRPDSTSSLLKFVVPTSLNIPAGGKTVKVHVSNSKGTDEKLYRLLPPVQVTGPDPVITDVVPVDGPFIRILAPVRINGQNFATNPAENLITFKITTGAGPVTYPKPGQSLQIDATQSNTTQIVVTVPDIQEVLAGAGTTPVTLEVGVGAHVPAARNILVIRT